MSEKPLSRKPGALDEDLSNDGDTVIFILKPMKSLIISGFLIPPIMTGLAAGGGLWYLLFQKLFYNPRYDLWTYYAIAAMPVLGLLLGLMMSVPKLFVRHEVSRRYIRSFSGIVIRNIETMDVMRIKDSSITSYGPFSTLHIVSRDVTSPLLDMNLIPSQEAQDAFLFLNDSAIDSITELRLARTGRSHKSLDNLD